MYAKNIISLYKILKKEPKTVDEVKAHEKGIKELKKLTDKYMTRHKNSNEIKKIKKIFSKYKESESLIGEVFGVHVNNSMICDEKVKNGIKTLLSIFRNKGSKKFSQAIKDEFVGLTLSEKEVENIFEAFEALFGVLSFSKSNMLKLISGISYFMSLRENNIEEMIKDVLDDIEERYEKLKSIYGEDSVTEIGREIGHLKQDLYYAAVNDSFNRIVQCMNSSTCKVLPSLKDICNNDELLKNLKKGASDFLERIHFQKVINSRCCAFGIDLKKSFEKKIEGLYNASRNKITETIKPLKEKVFKIIDGFEKTLSKESGKKPEPTRPLPTPPVRGKSSSDVPKKPLPTPQKNSGDKKNRGSKYLSEEEIQRLELALKNGPNSKKKSVQTSDGTPSSNDKSKNLEIPNDESKEPSVSSDKSKKSKKRRSGLFRKHPKDDNATNDKSKNSKNPNSKLKNSWRKSLKKRLSGSFGRPSKTSNDTSGNSTDEIPTES